MKNQNAVELGKLGGLSRAKKLSPERIREIARNAGRAGGWPKGRARKNKKITLDNNVAA